MGAITDGIATAFRDSETEGIPATGAHEPEKSEIRALGPLIENAVVQGRVPYSTWSELNAITGANGDGAEVIVTATGTHTDPITSATVANPGIYRYVTGSPAGWKRIGDNTSVSIATEAAAAEGEETTTAVAPAGLAYAVQETYGPPAAPVPAGGNLPDGAPLYNGSWLNGGFGSPEVEVAARDELTDAGVEYVAVVPTGEAHFFLVDHPVLPQVGDWIIASVVLEKDPGDDWPADALNFVYAGNIPLSGSQQSIAPDKGELLRTEELGDDLRRFVLRGQLGTSAAGTVVTAPVSSTFIVVHGPNAGIDLKASAFAVAYSPRMPAEIDWRSFDPVRWGEYGARLDQLDGGGALQSTPGLIAPADYFLVEGTPLALRKAGLSTYREASAFDFAAYDAETDVVWDDGRELVLEAEKLVGPGAIYAMKTRDDTGIVYRRPVTWHTSPAAQTGSPKLLAITDSLGYRGWVSALKTKMQAAGLTPTMLGTFKEINGEWGETRSAYHARSYTYARRFVNADGSGQTYPIRTGAGSGVTFSVTRSGGVITAITPTGGTGYDNHTAIPLVISGGGGSKAFATIAVAGGVPGAVTIVNGGTGYATDPTITMPPTVTEYNALSSTPSDFGDRWPYNPFIRPATGGDAAGHVFNTYIFDVDFFLTRFSLADPDRVYFGLDVNDILAGAALADIMEANVVLYERTRAALPGKDIAFCLYGLSSTGATGWDGCVAVIEAMLEQMIEWQLTDSNVFLLPFYQAAEMKIGYDDFASPSATNAVGVETGGIGDGIHPINEGVVQDDFADMAFGFEMCRA